MMGSAQDVFSQFLKLKYIKKAMILWIKLLVPLGLCLLQLIEAFSNLMQRLSDHLRLGEYPCLGVSLGPFMQN